MKHYFYYRHLALSGDESFSYEAHHKMAGINPNWVRRFYTLWTGQALSLLGSQLVQFAIIWYLTQTTKSATTLATAASS